LYASNLKVRSFSMTPNCVFIWIWVTRINSNRRAYHTNYYVDRLMSRTGQTIRHMPRVSGRPLHQPSIRYAERLNVHDSVQPAVEMLCHDKLSRAVLTQARHGVFSCARAFYVTHPPPFGRSQYHSFRDVSHTQRSQICTPIYDTWVMRWSLSPAL
jgi:hypothetical protein